jgi:hypothetical protein
MPPVIQKGTMGGYSDRLLVFECKNGFLHATVKNVRQDIDWSVGIGTTGYIGGGRPIFYNMDYKWPSCRPLTVLYNGDLVFQ